MTFALMIPATLLALLLPEPQQRQSDPEAQLVAAIHEEMVAGYPASAIEQYKSIVTQSGVSRAVAAAALLRIGECQEKLGRSEEARATYLHLINSTAINRELWRRRVNNSKTSRPMPMRRPPRAVLRELARAMDWGPRHSPSALPRANT